MFPLASNELLDKAFNLEIILVRVLIDVGLILISRFVLTDSNSLLILDTVGLRLEGPLRLIWAVKLNAAIIISIYTNIPKGFILGG